MPSVLKCLVFFLSKFWLAQAQLQWFSEVDGRVQWAYNCSFVGSDLGKVSRRNREECAELCFETTQCTRFTWTDANGGTCRFRGGNEQIFSTGDGGVCGYVTTDTFLMNDIVWQYIHTTRWAFNCDFAGPTIMTRKVPGSLCGTQCLNHEDCIGFAWTTYQGGTCWLKSRGHPIIAYTGAVDINVCGEISGRKASYGSSDADGSKRKSELACHEYNGIASHYRTTRSDPLLRIEYPWMAAVGYKLNKQIIFRCDGTIISDFHILVAAHCVDVDPVPEIVRLGTHTLKDGRTIDMDIQSITKHLDFVRETSFETHHRNDIALIKLKLRITFSDRILPACLRVNINDLHRNDELIATGWEITEEGNLSNVLKKTRVRTVNLRTCQADYQKNGSVPTSQITKNQYCVTDPYRMIEHLESSPDDSGGPIQIFARWQSLPTVVGIASFRKRNELPDVYTRVASFLDWIEENVWSD